MSRLEQKRSARHIRVAKTKHDRFVSAYLKNVYPNQYAEAELQYEKLNRKYPTKRDLTKTTEYLKLSTGYDTFVEYYRAQSAERAQKPEKKNTTQEMCISLEIPLMDKHDINVTTLCQKADESLLIPEDVYTDLVTELTKDPELYNIFHNFQDCLEEEQQVIPGPVPQEEQQVIPGPVPQEEQQVIPGPVPQEEQVKELDEIVHELFQGGQTPLENELSCLGY